MNLFKYALPFLFFFQSAYSADVLCQNSKLSLSTLKVVHITDEIVPSSIDKVKRELAKTYYIKGDRLVIINSPGGYVDVGAAIIAKLRAEAQLNGTKLICIVDQNAHSMAFNTLSNCDVKLAISGSRMLVHKIRARIFIPDATARVLRQIASDLDRDDEPYRQMNAKQMHLSLPDYDKYADIETYFTAERLFKMHYLDGICSLIE